jgi:3-dehydroquinate synthase
MNNCLEVTGANSNYPVNIGTGMLANFARSMGARNSYRQVVLVTDQTVYKLYGQILEHQLQADQLVVHVVQDGEVSKTWNAVLKLLDILAENSVHRDALLIALGGGVIGDMAGFVASIYQRGIDFVQVPTTLLAQVDSSVGGKVGINHRLGKNLIGSFYHPTAVWADLETLLTLDDRDWRAGMAEVVKYAVIRDREMFRYIQEHIEAILARDLSIVEYLVGRCIAIKAAIVAEDEREQETRMLLNYGHTVGHALESLSGYTHYRHGEAVAVGMVTEAILARNLGYCSNSLVQELQQLLLGLGLEITVPVVFEPGQLVNKMRLDKKVRNGELVFALPLEIGNVQIVSGVQEAAVSESLEAAK